MAILTNAALHTEVSNKFSATADVPAIGRPVAGLLIVPVWQLVNAVQVFGYNRAEVGIGGEGEIAQIS